MKIKTLKCNNCGADLKINPKIKFFNCTFCNSSLTIKTSGNIAYTEVIEDIKANTEELLINSETILIEKEIERLDREWAIKREKYRLTNDNGGSLPNSNTGIITLIVTLIVIAGGAYGLKQGFWVEEHHDAPPYIFIILPIIFIVVMLMNTFSQINKSENYRSANMDYTRQRNALLKKLPKKK